jgi:hypothetical protein
MSNQICGYAKGISKNAYLPDGKCVVSTDKKNTTKALGARIVYYDEKKGKTVYK